MINLLKDLYKTTPFALSMTISNPKNCIDIKSFAHNLYSSIYHLTNSPFKKGDKVKIQGYEGVVEQMDWKYLKLKKNNSTVFIPTESVFKSVVEVFYK